MARAQVPTIEWEDLEAAHCDASTSSTLIREAVDKLDQAHRCVCVHCERERANAVACRGVPLG